MIRIVHPGPIPPDTNPDFLPILDSETKGQNVNKKAKTCEQIVIRNNFCENKYFYDEIFADYRKKLP
jgi:hypothetical protein